MAELFLNAGERFFTTNNAQVYGSLGATETIAIDGLPLVKVDQQIERVELAHNMNFYKIAVKGNQALIYDGRYLIAQIAIQVDPDGTQLSFADGSANLKITGLNQMTLGGVHLENSAQTLVSSAMNAEFNTTEKSSIVIPQDNQSSIILIGYSPLAPDSVDFSSV